MRGIRTQLHSLVGDLSTEDNKAMSLGLAHSLSRYKLKFSPDKVDTMIVQAICESDHITPYHSSILTSHPSPLGRFRQGTQHIRHESQRVVRLAFPRAVQGHP